MSETDALDVVAPVAHARRGAQRPAELMTAPVVVLSLVALVINDHWLKGAHASWLTGKASDVAGLVVAPVMLVGLVEVAAWLLERKPPGSHRSMVVAAVAVGIVFATIQVLPPATEAYAKIAGWSAHLVAGLMPFVSSAGGPANVTADPTDLVALFALLVPLRLSTASTSSMPGNQS